MRDPSVRRLPRGGGRKKVQEEKSESPFSAHLTLFQYSLLTCPADELVRSFIPLSWHRRFDAVQVQFIREDREPLWLERSEASCGEGGDDQTMVRLHYTIESSDDSDEFDDGAAAGAGSARGGAGESPQTSQRSGGGWNGSSTENASSGSEQPAGQGMRVEGPGREVEREEVPDDTATAAATRSALSNNVPMMEIENQQDRGEKVPTPMISIDEIRARTESLYTGGQVTPGMLEKQALYLGKIASKPDVEEALTELFILNGNAEEAEASGEKEQCQSDHAPRSIVYMVERKESSTQVSNRMARIMKTLPRQCEPQSLPKGLCYCLSKSYCRLVAKQLERSGITAEILLVEDAQAEDLEQILERFRSSDFQVLCLTRGLKPGTRLPPIDFVFHVSVPASLRVYAEDTLLSAQGNSPSICVIFYRLQDRIETERSIGLVASRKGKCKGKGTLLKGAERKKAEHDLNEVAKYCSDGSMCRLSKLTSEVGGKGGDYSCKHATCCDNCRLRLAQDGGIIPMKAENRSIVLGSTSDSIQDVRMCQVNITSVILELLRRLRTQIQTNSESVCSYSQVRCAVHAIIEDIDSSLGLENAANDRNTKRVVSRWARISPLQSLSLASVTQRLIRMFTEQGIMSASRQQATSEKKISISQRLFDSFIAQVAAGNTQFCLRNARLFAPYFNEGQCSNPTATGQRQAPVSTTSTVTPIATTPAPVLTAPALPPALAQVPARSATDDIIELPDELYSVAEGITLPMLRMPLKSLAWLRFLPFLIQYELLRLFNDRQPSLTESQLEHDIKDYFDNAQNNNRHSDCKFIHQITGTADSMLGYEAVTAAASTSESSVDTGSGSFLFFSATYGDVGIDKVSLLPPEKAIDCRMFRKFGSHRFLLVFIPEKVPAMQVVRLIEKEEDDDAPLMIAGRRYRYLWSDISKSPQEFYLFAESGIGIESDEEISVDEVREWCLPPKLNHDLSIARESLCLGLYFAKTTQSGALPTGCLDATDGFAAASSGVIPSGGCGLMSEDARDFVWSSYCEGKKSLHSKHYTSDGSGGDTDEESDEDEGCPYSSFQGVIGGMRGVWIFDPALKEKGIQFLCRKSQKQFNVPMKSLSASGEAIDEVEYDNIFDTVEVDSWDVPQRKDVCLNLRLIQVLEYRGVGVEFFKKCADEGAKQIAQRSESGRLLLKREAERVRDTGSYPTRRCRCVQLMPDHTDILEEDEAFLATKCDKEERQIEHAGSVLVTTPSPFFGSDVFKLKVVSPRTIRSRAERRASLRGVTGVNECEYFHSLKTGLVVNPKGKLQRLIGSRGGDFCEKLWVNWDVNLISQVQDIDDAAGAGTNGRLPKQQHLNISHKATANDRAKYIMQLRDQRVRAKGTESLLITLNDMKGLDDAEGKKISAKLYSQLQHPFQLYETEQVYINSAKLKFPHWQEGPSSGNGSRGYRSKKALGELWDYMVYKMSVMSS